MSVNLTPEDDYFNTFNPVDDYYELRSIAGRVEQSREDNEMQSIINYKLKRLGDSLYRDGSLVRYAGSLNPAVPTASIDNPFFYSLAEAEVYYDGVVHTVPAGSVVAPSTGSSSIGVLFTYQIITAVEDPNLRDLATTSSGTTPNYGQVGANRLKITKVWAMSTVVPSSNQVFVPVYSLLDGKVTKPVIPGQLDSVTQALETRTFNTSGNFVVQGFEVTGQDYSSDKVELTIGQNSASSSGSRAYVQGADIIMIQPVKQLIDKATDTQNKPNEIVVFNPQLHSRIVSGATFGVTYSGSTDSIPAQIAAPAKSILTSVSVAGEVLNTDYTISSNQSSIVINGSLGINANAITWLNSPGSTYNLVASYIDGSQDIRIPLSERPISQINQVKVVVNKTLTLQRLGAVNGDDIIPNSAQEPVLRIRSVRSGSTYYSQNADWLLVNSQTISWAPAGSEPAGGSTYYISADVEVTLTPSQYTFADDGIRSYLVLPAANLTSLPVPGEVVRVDYDFYLSRIDVVALDRDGSVFIARGDKAKIPTAPVIDPGKYLPLAEVTLGAGLASDNFSIRLFNNIRKTILEQNKIFERLERVELNTAINQLDSKAYQQYGATTSNLSGILTDGFRYTAEDYINDGVGGVAKVKFDKTYTSAFRILDALRSELTVPEIEYNVDLILDQTSKNNVSDSLINNTVLLGVASTGDTVISSDSPSAGNNYQPIGGTRLPIIRVTQQRDLAQEEDQELNTSSLINTAAPVFSRANLPPGNVDPAVARNLTNINLAKTNYLRSSSGFIYIGGSGFAASKEITAYLSDQLVPLTVVTSLTAEEQAMLNRSRIEQVLDATQAPNKSNSQASVITNSSGKFLAKFEIPAGINASSVILKVTDKTTTATLVYDTRGFDQANTVDLAELVTTVETTRIPNPVLTALSGAATGANTNLDFSYENDFSYVRVLDKTGVGALNYTSVLKSDMSAQAANQLRYTAPVALTGTQFTGWLVGPGGISRVMTVQPASGALPVVPKFTTAFDPQTGKLIVNYTVDNATRATLFVESASGGSVRQAVIAGTGSVLIQDLTISEPTQLVLVVENINGITVKPDPQVYVKTGFNIQSLGCAQSFTIPFDRVVDSVRVYAQLGTLTNQQAIVSIRELTSAGVPSNLILARGSVDLVSNATNFQVVFDNPVALKANREYCLVVDPSAVINVKVQLYTGTSTSSRFRGNFYTSIGSNSWSSDNNKTLIFDLFGPKFNLSNAVVTDDLKFSGSCEFNLKGSSAAVPTGFVGAGNQAAGFFFKANTLFQDSFNTRVSWQYSVDAGLSWSTFNDGTYVDFVQPTSQLKLRALFYSNTDTVSPILDIRNTIRLRSYLSSNTSTRYFQDPLSQPTIVAAPTYNYTPVGGSPVSSSAGDGIYTFKASQLASSYQDVKVVIQARRPSGTAIVPMFTDQLTGSDINTWSWVTPSNPVPDQVIDLPDGYQELTWNFSVAPNSNRTVFRLRLDLHTSSEAVTPRIRSVIAIVND